jgi:hypothetical protein
MFRCLNEGCPWKCGTHRNPTCGDRIMTYGLGVALLITLAVSLIWGAVAIRDGHYRENYSDYESASISMGSALFRSVRR